MSMTFTATMRLELALLALLVIVNRARAQLIPTCTGTVNTTAEDGGASCVVELSFCAGEAFFEGDNDLCGDGDFWESCGKVTFDFAINSEDVDDQQDIDVEDCENAASALLQAATLTAPAPAPELAIDDLCAELWDRYVVGIEDACIEYA